MMALVLDECEKNIRSKLKKLEEYQDALKTALSAIQNLRQIGEDLSVTPEQMLMQLLVDKDLKESSQIRVINEHARNGDVSNTNAVVDKIEKPPVREPVQSKHALERSVQNDIDSANLITNLMVTAGPKVGVKYKIEVTSPLSIDGTFWACHVESGFIQDKLEPLSERLRSCVQNDRKMWVVDDFSKLVCVKSADNGLWMRGKVIKQSNEQSVRVRFVDVGRTEDCQRSRLSAVPDDAASIPFMAFNCRLAEEPVKLEYETKWKFSDLTKKKILNFTVLKIIPQNEESFAYGKLDTILDSPPININDVILPSGNSSSANGGKEQNSVITSRDIRVQDGAGKSEGFVSVTEIIRNSSLSSEDGKQGSAEKAVKETAEISPSIPPIQIPAPSAEGEIDWGDSLAPGAGEHVPLSPLDENIFDSPTNSMGEKQLLEQLHNATKVNTGRCSDAARQPMAPDMPITFDEGFIKDNLQQLHQHQEKLLKNPPAPETQQLLAIVRYNITTFTQLLNDRKQSLEQSSSSSYFQSPTQLAPVLQPQVQNVIPPAAFPNLITQNPPIGTKLQQQAIAGLSNVFSTLQQQPQLLVGGLQTTPDNSADYLVKMKQFSDISRCLKTPSGLLDDQQIRQLQITKDKLERQLREEEEEEEIRKGQMGRILGLKEKSMCKDPAIQLAAPLNEIISTTQLEPQQKVTAMRENHAKRDLAGNNAEILLQKEPKADGRMLTNSPNSASQTSVVKSEKPRVSNDGTVEITHTSQIDTKPKFRNFVIPPYDALFTETKDKWIARELLNLEHPYLTEPKTRFFSVKNVEVRPGRFLPDLIQTYQRNSLLLSEGDAMVFKNEWARIEGPVFLLIKHQPHQPGATWRVGGLLQVVSNMRPINNLPTNAKFRHQCKINVVSTAVLDIDLRSNLATREIPADSMKRFISKLVATLQERNCMSMFEYQDQISAKQDQLYHSERTNHYQSGTHNSYYTDHHKYRNNFSSPPHGQIGDTEEEGENWDLELESTMKQSLASSEDIASGDDCERDLNAEIEAFDLDDE